jgi:hypothetical protein
MRTKVRERDDAPKGAKMLQDFKAENATDTNGNPTGGYATGIGFNIEWQNGPLGRGDDRSAANGAFAETVIAAVKQRLEFYQRASGSKFACRQNAIAITKLDEALMWLDNRTKEREARQVEGTHTP